jgi:dihydrofolate synthase/folylpolyglutamate synthase
MRFEDAVGYLNGLIDYEKRTPGKYDSDTYNLDAFRAVLRQVGNPHAGLNAVHVAGTDGKGSTCAFLESILRHAGLTTGFYSSPHLSSYAERIRLNGHPIPGEEFAALVEEVRSVLESMRKETGGPGRRGFATVFEILTTVAFLAFARKKVEVAIVEVGLGGRLDATNVIAPELCIITPVDLDHTHLLGATLAQIAHEKAGIIKPGVPVVTSPQSDEVMTVLSRIARERGSPLILSETVYAIEKVEPSPEVYRFCLGSRSRTLDGLRTGLIGQHQVSNARTAIVSAEQFASGRKLHLTTAQLKNGLAKTRWPGRTETVLLPSRNKNTVASVLDCAHTPQAGRVLRLTLEETYPERHFVFLLGLSADKQIPEFLRAVLRPGDVAVATRSDSPRSMNPDQLTRLADEALSAWNPAASHRVYATPHWESGLALAIQIAQEEKRLLCVAGSIYLVGLVRSRVETTQTE